MRLNDTFWMQYEMDLQEVKVVYLNWALGYAKEPNPDHRHLFLWEHQTEFCLVDSKYGRAFGMSPFGVGVRGVPRSKRNGLSQDLDEFDIALKTRLARNTAKIRSAIAEAINDRDLRDARQMALNYFWLKLGQHELLFDRIQLDGMTMTKGRRGASVWTNLTVAAI